MEKGLNLKGDELIRYLVVLILILAIILIIMVTIGSFMPKKQTPEDLFNKTMNQMKERELNLCKSMDEKSMRILCEIRANANFKNPSYCNSIDSNITYRLVFENVTLSARDYCWRYMGLFVNKTYCSNIVSENKDKVCK